MIHLLFDLCIHLYIIYLLQITCMFKCSEPINGCLLDITWTDKFPIRRWSLCELLTWAKPVSIMVARSQCPSPADHQGRWAGKSSVTQWIHRCSLNSSLSICRSFSNPRARVCVCTFECVPPLQLTLACAAISCVTWDNEKKKENRKKTQCSLSIPSLLCCSRGWLQVFACFQPQFLIIQVIVVASIFLFFDLDLRFYLVDRQKSRHWSSCTQFSEHTTR